MADFGLDPDETIEALPPPYLPRGAAWDLFYADKLTTVNGERVPLTEVDELLMDGPAGTGKTLAILFWMHTLAVEYPGSNFLFCRNVRDSMTATCLRTFEDQVLAADPEGLPIMAGRDRSQRESYKYPNTSRITLMGVVDAERAKSAEYDVVYGNEITEVDMESYEILTTRIRPSKKIGACPYKLLICDTNPSYEEHYINTRFAPQTKIPSRRVRLLSTHKDNPRYWDLENNCPTEEGAPYLRKLESLTGARKRRMLYGEWCGEEGLVYGEEFSEANMIDRVDLPPILYYVGAADFAVDSNTAGVLQVWGIDQEERAYMVAEHHIAGRGIDWWGEQAVKLYHKYRMRQIVCDPASPGMIELFNSRIGSRYGQQVGRIAIAGNNDHDAGIAQMKSALLQEQHRRDCPKDCQRTDKHGKPRMLFVRDALLEKDTSDNTVAKNKPLTTPEEIRRLPWKKTKDGQQHRAVWEPSAPHDGCDAARYLAMFNERRGLGTRRARSVNPYPVGSPGHVMWKEGRFAGEKKSA